MKKIVSLLLSTTLLITAATPVHAQFIKAADWEASGCAKDGVVTLSGITCLIKNIIFQLPPVIALAALAMVIFSGIRLVNAGADPKAYASALSTFQWAIIGLVLLSGAWLILTLIERLTGAPVTQFGIPQ